MSYNCRIGKITPKNGGATVRVIDSQRTIFHDSIKHLSDSIEPDTHAVGFWVLYKDGTVSSGMTYDAGFTASQCKGAFEHAKDCCMESTWGS